MNVTVMTRPTLVSQSKNRTFLSPHGHVRPCPVELLFSNRSLQKCSSSIVTMKPSHLKISAHSFLPSPSPWYYMDKEIGKLELDYTQHDLRKPLWKKTARRGPSAGCGTLEMLTQMPLDILYEVGSHRSLSFPWKLTAVPDIQPSTADRSPAHLTHHTLAKRGTHVARREGRVEGVLYAYSGHPILPD